MSPRPRARRVLATILVAVLSVVALSTVASAQGAPSSTPTPVSGGSGAADAGDAGGGPGNAAGDEEDRTSPDRGGGVAADESVPASAEGAGTDAGGAADADAPRCPTGQTDETPRADAPTCVPDTRCGDGEIDVAALDGADESSPCAAPERCGGRVDLTPHATEPTCVDQAELSSLLSEFEGAAAEEVEALAELTETLDELDRLERRLHALQEQLGAVQVRLGAAAADARFAEIRRDVADESLTDVSETLAAEEELLRRQALEAYMGGDELELGLSASVLEQDAGNDQATAREYAAIVIDNQFGDVMDVDALREAVVVLTDEVGAIESDARADAAAVAEIEREAAALMAGQRALVDESEAKAAALAERIADIQERKESFASQLQMSGVGGGSIGDVLRTAQAGQVPPVDIAGLLAMPLDETSIGSGYGLRVHPIFGGTRMHTGLDLSGAAGTEIHASADGVVVMAEEISGYGNAVVIDHGNTVATLYAHMTADAVTVGQVVETGDLIGFVGSTGYSTGPHLHFEVRLSGQPVDPIPYLIG